MSTLLQLLQSRWYWLTIALFGIALLGVALYYQYALGDEPCQVCIHARLWVVAFTLIALVMLITPQIKILRILGNGGVLIAGVGLKNIIAVSSDDALLVVNKDCTQSVKRA